MYVSLVKFTEQGIATMEKKGVARSKFVQRNVESLGGRLIEAYYCLGEYDIVAILEFSDNQTAMKASLLNSSLGHIKITTMPAVSRDEWRKILQKAWGGKPKKAKK